MRDGEDISSSSGGTVKIFGFCANLSFPRREFV